MLGCAFVEVRQGREVGDRERLSRSCVRSARARAPAQPASSPRPRRAGCRVGPGWRSCAASGEEVSWRSESRRRRPMSPAWPVRLPAGPCAHRCPRCRRLCSIAQREPARDQRVDPTAADHHPYALADQPPPPLRWCRDSRRGPSGSDPATGRGGRSAHGRKHFAALARTSGRRWCRPPPVRDLALPPRQMRPVPPSSRSGVPAFRDVAYAALVLPLRPSGMARRPADGIPEAANAWNRWLNSTSRVAAS